MHLHSVLALDPGSDMSSPRQGSSKASQHVVPFDPRSAGKGTGLLLKGERLATRVCADAQEDQGDHTQHTRRHLGHEGSQYLGRRVFAFPVSVFRHVQGKRRVRRLGRKGDRGVDSGRGNERRAGGDDQRKNNETKLGHFILELDGFTVNEAEGAKEGEIAAEGETYGVPRKRKTLLRTTMKQFQLGRP